MNFRITDDGNERDIHEIHEMLRDYNSIVLSFFL